MIKYSLFILLATVFAASGYLTRDVYHMKATVDTTDLVVKQKFVLDMLRHVHQPLTFTEYLLYGKTFVDGETYYTNWLKVRDFIDIYMTKMLPRGKVFTIMNERHLLEVKGLFHLFYYSKDWTVFMRNVVWARMHCNEGMFIYALTAAIIHRDDMAGIMLPSPYEIMPHKFITNEILTEGVKHKLRMMDTDVTTYTIWKNDTTAFDRLMNKEDVLTYFTEDVGLNTWYYFFHMDYPFWLGSKDLGHDMLHRGEKFLYFHQQLLARYYMERLSNDLGDIMEIDWTKPIVTGYYPKLTYFNGVNFPMRHNYYNVKTLTKRDKLIVKVMDYERRIRDIIDRGYIVIDDKKIDFTDFKTVDILGNLIHGNRDSYDFKFYRYLDIFCRLLLGGSFDTGVDYHVVPSVMEHFETTLRDPVFYQLYKRIVRFYFTYKDNLPVYTRDDLHLKGIRIDNVKVSKLVTYFDFYDIDITNHIDIKILNKYDTMLYTDDVDIKRKYNVDHKLVDDTMYGRYGVDRTLDLDNVNKWKTFGVDNMYDVDRKKMLNHKFDLVHDMMVDRTDLKMDHKYGTVMDDKLHLNMDTTDMLTKETWKYLIKYRTRRLNHEPITVGIDITSDKTMKVVVRTFLGPKYDVLGRLITLKDNRENFVEIDKFIYDLKVGKNMITRTSQDFFYTITDGTTWRDIYKRVMTGTMTKTLITTMDKDLYCGFPDRLLLPKGKIGGMEMRLFFIVTPVTKDIVLKDDIMTVDKLKCGIKNLSIFDDLPMGYPFDRKIVLDNVFMVDNVFVKDVIIFHRKDDDIRRNYVI